MFDLDNTHFLAFVFVSLVLAAFALGVLAGYAFFRVWHARRQQILTEWSRILEWQRDEALAVADRALQQVSQQRL
jgi:hypothetical protein